MTMEFFLQPIPLFIIALLGMLMHFFKKKIKGESFVAIRDYFKVHFKSTIIAIITTTIAFLAYYFELKTGQVADIFAVFGIGYTFDSMFNKWDKQ